MRYPTREYQRDSPSDLLLRRPQGIKPKKKNRKNQRFRFDSESHISSAGNLDAHLYRRTSKYGNPILAKRTP